MMFGTVSEHFANLRHVKRWKTCVSGLNALFRGTKLAKDPFYSIGTKMMFGSVSEHFANLRHVKRWKTCVSGLNALFRGTKLAKDPFYSIGTKMMFGSVSEHFANLRHVKRCKTCVRAWMHYYGVPNLRSIHSTPLEPKWCLGVFQSISLTFNT
jgi:acid stress-induced BolA-like protein IbaG/YrbA